MESSDRTEANIWTEWNQVNRTEANVWTERNQVNRTEANVWTECNQVNRTEENVWTERNQVNRTEANVWTECNQVNSHRLISQQCSPQTNCNVTLIVLPSIFCIFRCKITNKCSRVLSALLYSSNYPDMFRQLTDIFRGLHVPCKLLQFCLRLGYCYCYWCGQPHNHNHNRGADKTAMYPIFNAKCLLGSKNSQNISNINKPQQ
jgi:hypothetical protein